jgi:hypothetical protein
MQAPFPASRVQEDTHLWILRVGDSRHDEIITLMGQPANPAPWELPQRDAATVDTIKTCFPQQSLLLGHTPLLKLPVEIRCQIYELYFDTIRSQRECNICSSVPRAEALNKLSGRSPAPLDPATRALVKSLPIRIDLCSHLEHKHPSHGCFGARGRFREYSSLSSTCKQIYDESYTLWNERFFREEKIWAFDLQTFARFIQSVGSRQPNFKGALWLIPEVVYSHPCQATNVVKPQQEFIRALLKKIESDGLVPSVAKGMLIEHISRLGMWKLWLAGNEGGDVLQSGGENWKVKMRVWHREQGTSLDEDLKLKIWGDIGRVQWGRILVQAPPPPYERLLPWTKVLPSSYW